MISYRPKALFQQNNDERVAFAQLASNPLLHKACAYAQADMAAAGFGPDEMRGANNFVICLLNLSENIELPKALPSKPLVSYDEPAPKKTTTQ